MQNVLMIERTCWRVVAAVVAILALTAAREANEGWHRLAVCDQELRHAEVVRARMAMDTAKAEAEIRVIREKALIAQVTHDTLASTAAVLAKEDRRPSERVYKPLGTQGVQALTGKADPFPMPKDLHPQMPDWRY